MSHIKSTHFWQGPSIVIINVNSKSGGLVEMIFSSRLSFISASKDVLTQNRKYFDNQFSFNLLLRPTSLPKRIKLLTNSISID